MLGIGTIGTASAPGPSPDKPLIERENCPMVSLVTMFLSLLKIKERHVLFSFLSPGYSDDDLSPLQKASPNGEAEDSNSSGVFHRDGHRGVGRFPPGVKPPPAWRPLRRVCTLRRCRCPLSRHSAATWRASTRHAATGRDRFACDRPAPRTQPAPSRPCAAGPRAFADWPASRSA
jgi:hypothetical protein